MTLLELALLGGASWAGRNFGMQREQRRPNIPPLLLNVRGKIGADTLSSYSLYGLEVGGKFDNKRFKASKS